jgi:hypothetical protein
MEIVTASESRTGSVELERAGRIASGANSDPMVGTKTPPESHYALLDSSSGDSPLPPPGEVSKRGAAVPVGLDRNTGFGAQ